jgi:hypothetical protein
LHNSDVAKGPFLACVIYFDEMGEKYQQAFRYRRGVVQPNYITLEVLPEPKSTDVCPPPR